MPVRVGAPQGVGGLMDQLSNPAFSTPIGLLLWGAHHAGEEPIATPPLVAQRRRRPGGGLDPGPLPGLIRPGSGCGVRATADHSTAIWRRLWITSRPYVEKTDDARSGSLARIGEPAARRVAQLHSRSNGRRHPHAATVRRRAFRTHQGHRRRRRRQQRREPDDPRRDDGRRVHRREHRRPGAPPERRPAQDPDRRQADPRPGRRRRPAGRAAGRRGGLARRSTRRSRTPT